MINTTYSNDLICVCIASGVSDNRNMSETEMRFESTIPIPIGSQFLEHRLRTKMSLQLKDVQLMCGVLARFSFV